jgi:hypothetical protein
MPISITDAEIGRLFGIVGLVRALQVKPVIMVCGTIAIALINQSLAVWRPTGPVFLLGRRRRSGERSETSQRDRQKT